MLIKTVEMTIWKLVKPMNDKRLYHADNMEVENENHLFHFQILSEKYKGIKCWSNLSGNTYFS